MKKLISKPHIVLLLILVGFFLLMELCFQGTVMKEANLSEEQVLKEMPSIAISEADLEMGEYLLALPEVQAMLDEARAKKTEQNPSAEIEPAAAEILLGAYIPEGYEIASLFAFAQEVDMTLTRGEEEMIVYAFLTDGSAPQKTIGVYKNGLTGRTCKACYTNDTMGIRKLVLRHQWFGWLTQR